MGISARTLNLHLALTPKIGGKTVSRVAARNSLLGRSPEEFLRLSPEAWTEEYRFNRTQAASLDARRKVKETEVLEQRLDGLGVRLVTAADAAYPALIEQMDPDPPGVLFLYGNLALLERATFSVLASRNASPGELLAIEKLTEEGVLQGEVVVSGHDRPEYQRSAIVPLRWGAPRILCFDRGLFQVLGDDLKDEAFRAARLWRYQYDPTTDLAVTPFRPEAEYIGVNNKVRDRLVACLSRRLSFVRLSPGGNMEGLVRMALKAGRPVSVPAEHPAAAAWAAAGADLRDPG